MMGVVMGMPPPKEKELREHQKGQAELRGISRKLAHVAGKVNQILILGCSFPCAYAAGVYLRLVVTYYS